MNVAFVPAAVRSATPPQDLAKHRADIDGLRAVAVLAVVLTHAGNAAFRGGFVGVDIFFVISGYLITRNLQSASSLDLSALASFYARRMRRTLPALYVMAAFTLGVACFLLLPGELDDLVRSLVATILFVPNLLFMTQEGYFNHAAIAKPLLHTWSLGVEEQFYLVAPLLPLALRYVTPAWRKASLIGLFVGAFVLCIAIYKAAPSAAFYLMPARLWEFLLGSLVAERVFPPPRAAWIAELVAAAALIGLIFATATFSAATVHPGVPTLLPCLATAALIHVGSMRATLITRLLGNRILAGIGLISYSIYLWHWPLLVLLRRADMWPVSTASQLLAGAGLIGVSTVSWYFVEGPFRRPGSPVRREARTILTSSAVLLGGACFAILGTHGLPNRFPPDVAAVARFYNYRDTKPYREGTCFITSKNRLGSFDRDACLALDPHRRNVLVLGDSHAAHLWTGLSDTWPGTHFLQATASGCKPLLETSGARRCTVLMSRMLRKFLPAHHVDGVILSALWSPDDIATLQATVAYLTPLVGRVTVFGPMLRYDEPVATLLARSMLQGDLSPMKDHEVPGQALLDERMRAALTPVATYISPYQAMCPHQSCRLFATKDVPMQFDYHHLTKEGADTLMREIKSEETQPEPFTVSEFSGTPAMAVP